MQVQVKYLNEPKNTDVLMNIASVIAGTGGFVPGLESGNAIAGEFNEGLVAGLLPLEEEKVPDASLNYLLYNKDMQLVDFGYASIGIEAKGKHQQLDLQVTPEQEGYLYIYTANETESNQNVYFDNLAVTQISTGLLAAYDYYPFGLPFAEPAVLIPAQKNLYQGKEWQDEHDLDVYDFHARMFDPGIGRFYGVDPQDQFASPYAGMGNNPVIGVDPDGEFVFTTLAAIFAPPLLPWAIGADIGMWSGSMANGTANPFDWDYSSGKTWGYMAGGAIVGAFSGGAANAVATSGIPFANTAAIMTGSYINSFGTAVYTGGLTDISVSFGVASINLTSGELDFLGKKGNSTLENIGYGLGAMANVQDAFSGFSGEVVSVKSRKKLAGHSWMEGEGINISVGPAVDNKPHLDGVKWESQYLFKTVKGRNFVTRYNPKETFSTKLNNINVSKLKGMTKNLNKGLSLSGNHSLRYGVWNGCVNQTSRALFKTGVFNFNAFLPITSPVLLNAELVLRNYGMMFSHYMVSY